MSAFITVGRAEVEIGERESVVTLYMQAVEETGLLALAEAVTLWESTEKPGDLMVLHRYANEEKADKSIELLSTSSFMGQLVNLADSPPDIRRYRIAGERGKRECDVAVGKVLSMSIRQADPGLGWDLDAELARILDEIAFIDGYLGSLHGRSVAVHEEILSIALWDNESAFRKSVPGHHLYTVAPYIRVR